MESEEECMKDSSRRAEATVLIQATFRMYRQRCRWRKIKSGMIALQRLTRYMKDGTLYGISGQFYKFKSAGDGRSLDL